MRKLCCWTTLSQIPGVLWLTSFLLLLQEHTSYWVISLTIAAGAQEQHQRFSVSSGLQAATQLLRNSMSILAAWHSGITKGGGLLPCYVSFARVIGRHFLWDFCPYPDSWWDQSRNDCCSLTGRPLPRISVSFHCDFWQWWLPKMDFTLCSSELLQLLLNKNKFMATSEKFMFLRYLLHIL